MEKLRGLGRGLDALLGGAYNPGEDSLTHIAVGLLRPSRFRLRKHLDPESIIELADSIKSLGVIQPIRVRPIDEGQYEIIAGERRWHAAKLAGLAQVPVVMRELPQQTALAMALSENIQRENLNPLEAGAGLRRLIEEFDMTHDAAAQAIGRSRDVINLVRQLHFFKMSPLPECKIEECLDELAHDGPLSYESACAWLEECLDEVAGPLDFDAMCAWLETSTQPDDPDVLSVGGAEPTMLPEAGRSDSRFANSQGIELSRFAPALASNENLSDDLT